jgi:hypothetical protein
MSARDSADLVMQIGIQRGDLVPPPVVVGIVLVVVRFDRNLKQVWCVVSGHA